jgi:uncharacterized surface protein with fasciclin (FAS1) repeats
MPLPTMDSMSVRPFHSPSPSMTRRGVTAGVALFAGLALLLSGCGDPEAAPPADTERSQENSIVAVAQAAGQFSDLLRAVEAAGLTQTLEQDGPFTVFAPTDGAFAGLPDGALEELAQDPDALAEILLYHVVPGEYTEAELRELTSLETAQGGTLEISVTREGVTIDGANILTANVPAANGIIHVITTVLMP